MKILQTIHDLGTKSGGLSSSVYNLVEALNLVGTDVTLVALAPTKGDTLCGVRKGWIHQLDNDSRFGTLSYSKNMLRYLDETDYDIYHTNGNWGVHNFYTINTARRRKKPFIISTHGNFYPQALKISHWKKKLAGALWVNKDLNDANVVCATSEQEMKYLREYGITSPIAVVPNVILIPDYISEIKKHSRVKYRNFGFLGRLHPIKNIDRIIEAWAKSNAANSSEAMLHIYGSGDSEYEAFLKQLSHNLNITNVVFEGWTAGRKKIEALADMSVLLSPSKQENFGMSIAESLLVKTPVLASTNTPWQELETYQCGWWHSDSVKSIVETINQILDMDDDTLLEMGERGQRLIIDNYSPFVVGNMMTQVYNWVMNPTNYSKPKFVHEI
ncbi:MAG: glycosyltransferase [Muribaculum sp.]|nr:glycosyltransferase [Muribaculum sp.]